MTDPRPTDLSPAARAGVLPLLDRLGATHGQMEYWLAELKSLVDHIEAQGWDTWSRDHARSLIDFFGHTARDHQWEVDRQVLPLVSARGDEMQEHVEQFRQDHGWLDESWSELNAQLQPVAEGFGGTDVDTLRQAANVYDGLLRQQLARERDVVVPAARAASTTEG